MKNILILHCLWAIIAGYEISYTTLTLRDTSPNNSKPIETLNANTTEYLDAVLILNKSDSLVYRVESYYGYRLTGKNGLFNFEIEQKIEIDDRPFKERLFSRYPMMYEDVELYIEEIGELYKDFVSLINIGNTHEHRNMNVVKIADKRKEDVNPSFWINCGIHAREWPAITSCVYTLKYILDIFKSNDVTNPMMKINWYILPILNIDGYIYSTRINNFKRKNMNNVDLNRNFPLNWGINATENDSMVESQVYGGESAASEMETKNLINFFDTVKTTFQASLDIHCFGQMIIVADDYGKDVNDLEYLMSVAQEMSDALYAKKNISYIYGDALSLIRYTRKHYIGTRNR